MSPPITHFSDIEGVDERIAEQLWVISLMWGRRGHFLLAGIIEKYYKIICAEFNGEIDSCKRQIEIQKIWRDIPVEMKDDVENAMKRVDELPRRKLTHATAKQ